MLPPINEVINYNKIKLPNKKTIGVRAWKVKDEKELLFSIETDDNLEKNKLKLIINFLKKLTDDPAKFDLVSESGLKKICLETRKLAKGETISYVQTCPHCRFKIEDSVNINKEQVIKEFDESPITINDNFIITVKDLDWVTTEKLYEKYEKTPKTFNLYHFINSIDSITYNGTTYTEFTPEEAEAYIDALDSDELDAAMDKFDEKSSECDLKRSLKCYKCGKEFDIDYGDLLSFLVL